LYLTTNIGNQLYKNSMDNPSHLDNLIVAAYLQNSFMPNGSIGGAGFQPIVTEDCNLSNLQFTLVDSNYRPIRLMSPMFVTLKVDPAEDPARDITTWKGKLPRNAPTAAEKAQMAAQEQAQAQEAEAKKKQDQDQMVEALTKALAKVIPGASPPPPPPSPAPPPQPSEFQNQVQAFVQAPEVPEEVRNLASDGTGDPPLFEHPEIQIQVDTYGDFDPEAVGQPDEPIMERVDRDTGGDIL
jgi:hypothetical protein